jgi:hypothetical protein
MNTGCDDSTEYRCVSLRTMQFSEIASRLTGFSIPIFGISWTPPTPDVVEARKVHIFLEDRRVLYNPLEVEVPEHCIDSVLQIRQFLTDVLGEGGIGDELAANLQAMRAACRRFLGSSGSFDASRNVVDMHGIFITPHDIGFNQALGELRSVFGLHIAQIAVKYGIDLEEELAFLAHTVDTALPVEPGED